MEQNDHRIIGKHLDLFHFQEEAMGSVFWHSKGFTIYNQLEQYIRNKFNEFNYIEVKTPQLMNSAFWLQSGHWDKYRENMFVVPDGDDTLALKPMNCPAHVQIFNQGVRSYSELPIRMAEFGCCHRNEAHGALHGLMRVRQMTQDDAHIFCRENQIQQETQLFCDMLDQVYADFGFTDVSIKLATRPEIRGGDDSMWDMAEAALAAALVATGRSYELAEGDGAFYGPKLEFHIKDNAGRSWQLGTLQLDALLPKRLNATYVGSDGNRHYPIMLHRAILGSLERFIGILLESSNGRLPFWITPIQVAVVSIVDDSSEYAGEVHQYLKSLGIRSTLDRRNNTLKNKVREHSEQYIPFICVVGRNEMNKRTVSIREIGTLGQYEMTFNSIPMLIPKLRMPGKIG